MPDDSPLRQSVAGHKVGAGMLLVGLIAAALLARKRLAAGAGRT